MAQNRRSAVPVIQKLVHEYVDRSTERIHRKISNIFHKCEERERNAEREMRKGRLVRRSASTYICRVDKHDVHQALCRE